jgi:hypothetical protein
MKTINQRQPAEIGFPHPGGKAGWSLRLGGLGVALWLAGASVALAQSNGVPGPQDYAAFSRFITDRNIFDPSRQPHFTSSGRSISRRHRAASPPDLQLVGTMSYAKGLFAFFNSDNPELKKALQAGDKIADYTVTEVSPDLVRLDSANHKEQFALRVGDGLRQENGRWVRADAGASAVSAAPAGTATGNATEATDAGSTESAGSTPATPASANQPNDVLKRLMELREKENQ